MRFHSQVFAHLVGVPLVGIVYEDKNKDFLGLTDVPCLAVEDIAFNHGEARQTIIKAIQQIVCQ